VGDEHREAIGVVTLWAAIELVRSAAIDGPEELIEGVVEDLTGRRDRGVGNDQLISIIFSRTA
jgi:hypothetical protein